MKVLIVDDEEEICKHLQRELRKEGYDVDYTTSPVGVQEKLMDAEKKGQGYAYELLLLDLRMPEIDGLTLLKEIQEAQQLDLDVIIITAYGDEDMTIKSIRLGAIDYLRKPISLEELQTAVFRIRQKRAGAEKKALNYRILVVDDEKELCARIKRELKKESYQLAVAYDGAEGLEYFKNNCVDVAIVDVKMPRMDGLEMLEKCRAINSDFVSIVITGHGDHEKAIKALKLGVFDYLTKPISLEELITVVSNGVDLLALRRGLSARKRELEIETALKTQYAERLEKLLKELEAKNAEMDRFTYTVSHDLRSPLETIRGFAEILRGDLERNEKERVERDLKSIENGMTKMEHLLNDTLQLSRIGRVANPPEDVPFGEIVQEALEQTAEQMKTNGIEISVAGDFPAVHVDRMRIAEVLVNLITNSINYMGEQTHPGIDMGYRVDGEETVFFVRDNGIGIDNSQHEKVFELFYKLDSKSKGTGAGLAIVKRIIEVHEGRIWIESEKGKGCTVCFTLPAASLRKQLGSS